MIVDLKLGIGVKFDDFGIKFLFGFFMVFGIDDMYLFYFGGCLCYKLFSFFMSVVYYVGMFGF